MEKSQFAGQFYPTNYDVAMCMPMMEMATNKFKFMPEAMYVYNVGTQMNDWTVNRENVCTFGRILRDKKPYDQLFSPRHFHPAKFLYDDPLIISSATDFSDLVSILNNSDQEYVCISKNQSHTFSQLQMQRATHELERTFARVVYFMGSINRNLFPMVKIDRGVYAAQYKWFKDMMHQPDFFEPCLVRKNDLHAIIEKHSMSSLDELYQSLAKLYKLPKQVALFYLPKTLSKAVCYII